MLGQRHVAELQHPLPLTLAIALDGQGQRGNDEKAGRRSHGRPSPAGP